MSRVVLLFTLSAMLMSAQDRPLFNGKNLDGWEIRGDGIWTVMKDGTLIGQRPHPDSSPVGEFPIPLAKSRAWASPQSWLYTVANDFDQFNLHVEYWIPPGGNSGISIRDTWRGRCGPPGAERAFSRSASPR